MTDKPKLFGQPLSPLLDPHDDKRAVINNPINTIPRTFFIIFIYLVNIP